MSSKELAHVLLDKVPDNKIMEVVDLLSVSENTLDFWDNKEDEVWDSAEITIFKKGFLF